MNDRAIHFNEQGTNLADEGQPAEAICRYQKAIEADPGWATPWFNLG
jgi:Flp pilus assembly protein TadD